MNDVWIIARKELKEFWKARGSLRARLLSFLPLLLVFGIYLPLQQRQSWTEVPAVSGIWFMMLPLVLAGGTAADSFAGERERHTLETLLATRLSDKDIFLGKVLATVLYCVGITWSCALLGWIALNATKGSQPWFMYTAPVLALITVGSALVSLLMTAVGVLVSLRAASVRAAAQVFSLVTLVLFIGLPVLLQALPASVKEAVGQALVGANWTMVGLIAAGVVLLADLALLALGVARFQRPRLILE
jgi:ABC-2 type transport system permease protein